MNTTRPHDKFLRTGLARLAAPASSPGRTATGRAYATAIDDLAGQAGLAA